MASTGWKIFFIAIGQKGEGEFQNQQLSYIVNAATLQTFALNYSGKHLLQVQPSMHNYW